MSEARRYLLERVDEAAIVQYYADGFEALPLGDEVCRGIDDHRIHGP